MVTILPDKLIIELEHPKPEEFLKDLPNSLLSTLRLLCLDAASEAPLLNSEEFCDASFAMIHILQVIIFDERSKTT